MSGTTLTRQIVTVSLPGKGGLIGIDAGKTICADYYSSLTKVVMGDIVKLRSVHDGTLSPDELDPLLQHLQYRTRGIGYYRIEGSLLSVRLVEKFTWNDVREFILEALRRYPFDASDEIELVIERV